MRKIGILTDSGCDLLKEEIDNNIVKILPLNIIFTDGVYKDGVDISAEEVYGKMTAEIPKTSLPSGEDIEKVFNDFIEDGFTDVLGIFISSNLSGTFNAVNNFKHEFEDKINVHLIDSKNLSIAQGLCVKLAQDKVKEGENLETIVSDVSGLLSRLDTYFVLDTLDYLIKGGRIGKVAGNVGKFLHLIPVIHVNEEGIYHTVDKGIGKIKAKSKLFKIIEEHCEARKCNVHFVHGGVFDEAEAFRNKVQELDNIISTDLRALTPSLSVHTGPGLIGAIVERLY